MLASFSSGEFLLHIPWSLHFYLGSFFYRSHTGFFFFFLFLNLRNFSSTSHAGFLFANWEFLLHTPFWLNLYLGSLSYTLHASFICLSGVSLTHPMHAFLQIGGVSLTHPVMAYFLCEEFLLHIPCWLLFDVGSFSYTSHVGFCFYLGSFPHTSRAGFIFIWGISLTYPVLASFSSGEFLSHIPCLLYFSLQSLLHIPCWLLFFRGGGGGSPTNPVLASSFFFSSFFFFSFLFSSFFFYLGSFPHISRGGLIFIWGFSLTHPVLVSFLSGEFLLHIPCFFFFFFLLFFFFCFFFFFLLFFFNLASFPHRSRGSFIFIWGVSLTYPVLASFLSGDFLWYIPFWFHFYLGSFS